MIVVKYFAGGMKSVAAEGVTMSEFWALFRRIKRRCEDDDPDSTYAYRLSGRAFEVVDERRADGATRFVARPDDWPRDCGEPA